MPLYDYRCEKGHTFDAIRPMDSVTTVCPDCGTESTRVFVVAPAVIIRPAGYQLKPGDKDYYKIPNERHPHIKSRYREIQSWQFNSRKNV